jgi:hypothetical protein
MGKTIAVRVSTPLEGGFHTPTSEVSPCCYCGNLLLNLLAKLLDSDHQVRKGTL